MTSPGSGPNLNPPADPTLKIEHDLDRYFAGEMSKSERAQFESVASEVIADERALRDVLGEAFAPPPRPTPIPRSSGEGADVAGGQTGLLAGLLGRGLGKARGLILAAGLIGIAVALSIAHLWSEGFFIPGGAVEVDPCVQLYNTQVDAGFKPSVPMSDLAELSMQLSSKLARDFSLQPPGPGIELLGFSSASGKSASKAPAATGKLPGTPLRVQLLARVDGKPVILLMDLSPTEPSPLSPEPCSGTSEVMMHRTVIAGIELIELSPFTTPRVIPLVRGPK